MAPAAIGLTGLGSTIAGGALGVGGNLFKGASEMQMYNYQAGIAQINAGIARKNAEYAYQKGDKEAEKYGIRAGQQAGQIKASQASSGLDVNFGSAKQVQDSQTKVAQTDMAQIRQNAAKVAYDYSMQAWGYDQEAKMKKAAGRNAMISGVINAAGSIVGTAGSVANKWLQGSQVGLDTGMKSSLGA